VFRHLPHKKFITLFLCLLNEESGTVVFANSGHAFPVLISRDGSPRSLEMVNYPIGIRTRFTESLPGLVSLADGDTMLLYTDGLIEAQDLQGRMLGYGFAEEILMNCRKLSAPDIRDRLLEELRRRCGPGDLADDVSLLVIRRQAGKSDPRRNATG
jgi:phosphoserine phosphatase RsbU/P